MRSLEQGDETMPETNNQNATALVETHEATAGEHTLATGQETKGNRRTRRGKQTESTAQGTTATRPRGGRGRQSRAAQTAAEHPPPAGPATEAAGKQLTEAGDRLERSGQEAQQAGEELRQSGEALRAAREQCEELRRAVQQAQEQLNAIRRQSQQARSEFEEVERVLGKARSDLQKTREEAETVRQQSGAALKDFQEAGKYLSTARVDSQQLKQEFQQAEQHLQAVHKQAEQARGELQQAHSALQAARQQSEQAKQELARAHHELDEARQQARQAEAEFQKVKRETETAREELRGLQRQIEESRQQAEHALYRAQAERQGFEGLAQHVTTAELMAAETPTEGVVYAVARAESAQDRLLRYLNDAWAVEKDLVSTLKKMAEEVVDPTLRGLFAEHREVTQRQQEAIEARLRALGKEPSGGKGFFSQLLTKMLEALKTPQDDLDRIVQDLMKGFGTEHFEIAMYQALEAYARAIGDEETARLATLHMQQEQEAADKLRPLIAPTAARVAVGSEVAAETARTDAK